MYLGTSLDFIQKKDFPDFVEIEGKMHRVIFHKSDTASGRFLGVYYPNPVQIKSIPVLDKYVLFIFIDDNTKKSWLQSKEK